MFGFLSPSKIKSKILEYRRVISVSRKPDREEFISSTKITGIGLMLIGFIGFIISMIYLLLK